MDAIVLRSEVEEFLYDEADLLDRWELLAWFDLFVEDCEYSLPPTDMPDADPKRHTFLVHDDRFLLKQRVESLLTKTAHAEWPHSRTRRQVGNVRVREEEGMLSVHANFIIHRIRYEKIDCYIGQYRHVMLRDEAGRLRFKHRKAVLDLDALRPHGKVSIII